jgi:hypothetical protein
MTIQTETNKVVYVMDGTSSTLTIPFYFFDKQIAVYKNDSTIPLVCDVDYTITNQPNYQGGEISFIKPIEKGATITIKRNVELTQLVKFIEGEKFPAQDFEYSLDKMIMALQQLKEEVSRAISIPQTSTITAEEFLTYIKDICAEFDTIKQIPQISESIKTFEQTKPLKFTNITLTTDMIEEDNTYKEYKYKADIYLQGVTANYTPNITLELEDITSATFAPIAEAYDGFVRIYLKSIISKPITIPVILLY